MEGQFPQVSSEAYWQLQVYSQVQTENLCWEFAAAVSSEDRSDSQGNDLVNQALHMRHCCGCFKNVKIDEWDL